MCINSKDKKKSKKKERREKISREEGWKEIRDRGKGRERTIHR